MIYRVFHPAPALSHIVDYYWYVCAEASEIPDEQHFYTPLIQTLVFTFSKQDEHHALPNNTFRLNQPAYLFGQGTGPRVVTSNGVDYLGVKFKPLGIAKVTGINMEHFADQIICAEDIWCNELDLLWDEMQSMPSIDGTINVLEKFLIAKHLKATISPKIDCAQNALALINQTQGNIDIKTLQEQTNTLRKTLERAFVHNLGVHPKLYARIVRFNAAKDRLDRIGREESLTAIALDCGFYDSSHFTSEFKIFSGFTPLGYLKKIDKDFILTDR
ncbi:AraC family transcriptional regulator [Parapedobacter defluvii]|uniref:AraC family transcriptional regulator n=1 Tax=Parapedobacter defluvii TaxID=2045106 RepID=A0ABQ1N5G2_9SPHI|nr:helix-turn-helix domain-containing protein [Parapedobacter defluvii]GGC49285.1 AraC family transcriptional regulator [Parapedobacter defluvii]